MQSQPGGLCESCRMRVLVVPVFFPARTCNADASSRSVLLKLPPNGVLCEEGPDLVGARHCDDHNILERSFFSAGVEAHVHIGSSVDTYIPRGGYRLEQTRFATNSVTALLASSSHGLHTSGVKNITVKRDL